MQKHHQHRMTITDARKRIAVTQVAPLAVIAYCATEEDLDQSAGESISGPKQEYFRRLVEHRGSPDAFVRLLVAETASFEETLSHSERYCNEQLGIVPPIPAPTP